MHLVTGRHNSNNHYLSYFFNYNIFNVWYMFYDPSQTMPAIYHDRETKGPGGKSINPQQWQTGAFSNVVQTILRCEAPVLHHWAKKDWPSWVQTKGMKFHIKDFPEFTITSCDTKLNQIHVSQANHVVAKQNVYILQKNDHLFISFIYTFCYIQKHATKEVLY